MAESVFALAVAVLVITWLRRKARADAWGVEEGRSSWWL